MCSLLTLELSMRVWYINVQRSYMFGIALCTAHWSVCSQLSYIMALKINVHFVKHQPVNEGRQSINQPTFFLYPQAVRTTSTSLVRCLSLSLSPMHCNRNTLVCDFYGRCCAPRGGLTRRRARSRQASKSTMVDKLQLPRASTAAWKDT